MKSEICECGHPWRYHRSDDSCATEGCSCKKCKPQNNSLKDRARSSVVRPSSNLEDKEPSNEVATTTLRDLSNPTSDGSDNHSPPIQRDGSKTEDKIDSDKDYLTSSGSDNQKEIKHLQTKYAFDEKFGSDDDESLSDKIGISHTPILKVPVKMLFVKDVKEFVKKLKDEYLKLITRVFNNTDDKDVIDLIDSIFGDDLI